MNEWTKSWLFASVGIALAAISHLAFAAGAHEPASKSFRDCTGCPEMMIVPTGNFLMGSPVSDKDHQDNESPQHRVTISKSFAMGKFEVTRGQYARFVNETHYDATLGGCDGLEPGADYAPNTKQNWINPGWRQADDHPVVCISWNDASAYVSWLAKKTGKPYRLPTEAEWEYSARGGTTTTYWWGDNVNTGCKSANGGDLDALAEFPKWTVAQCHDGHILSAPVGSFSPNAFGLYDTAGNAWELTADCMHDNYMGAPTDGSAWLDKGKPSDCKRHPRRGGSWDHWTWITRSASRLGEIPNYRKGNTGFRVARDM